MQCPRCQQENPPQAKFCLECATPLALRCANCGTQLPAGAKFCFECATPVSAPGSPPRFTSPEAYTPKHLAERIINSKAALEGERKQVTVLFADLKGSMELLADRDPEEARKLLDPVLEHMMEAVHRYEGTVNQVMGDGIMALFGAPVAHEDHAVRACYAALRMQDSVKRYAEVVQRAAGIPIQIRVGLNSGEVVVRSIGSDLHMDYTAVGQTTHLAARMEQTAMPGSILMTADTLRLAEGYVQVRPLGPVNVKGLEVPVEVYEVTGAAPLRSRFHAAASRGLTRFVGRTAEMDHLGQALTRAASGRGQVVAIVGEAGVGKSRLVWEVAHSHRTQGWVTLLAGAVPYGKATPYRPVIALLKSYFGILDRDEHPGIRDKINGKLVTLDDALLPALPVVLALFDIPIDDPQWHALDPSQRRQRTMDSIKRLLLRESHVQPLLVVFEDLHWIDGETQALLDSLIESLATARICLLVTYRPEYAHHWGGKTVYTQLRLDPLPPGRAGELLDTLLGPDESIQPLKPLLIERTEGNPFFVEESVRTLVESHVLVGERGAHRLETPLADIRVPATVEAVLASRIDRLPPEAKRLLQEASVIGKDVPTVLLKAIADTSDDELRRWLGDLRAAEFLYETSPSPDPAYTFTHALTHDVAYASLLRDRRRALHARIVEALEQLYPDRLIEHVEELGHHALRGEVWAKAVAYLRQAGLKVASRSAHREAVTFFEHALMVMPHLPETRETLEQAIDLRIDLRNALWPLGEHRRIPDLLVESEALAKRVDDRRRLGWIYSYMSAYCWGASDLERAREFGEQALGIAAALADADLEVPTNVYLGLTHFARGDYRRSIEALSRNVVSLAGARIRERFGHVALPSVSSRHWLDQCLVELGQFADADRLAEEALAISEAVDHPFSLTVAWIGVAFPHLGRGAGLEAIGPLERALALCQTLRIPLTFPWIALHLGNAYALAGRLADAIPLLEQAVERAAAWGTATKSWAISSLAEVYLLAGRSDEAETCGRRALHLAREHNMRGQEASALRVVAEIAARRDPPDIAKADEGYREALLLATELGMRPLVAHCHLGLGKLYRRTDKREQAQEHLATAMTMYREMGMTYWLEKAEAEMRELGTAAAS